ncbi:SH3 domain-containing protein [Microbacterium elymi]|uniref:SH3 domain-containing protein n=1 Tax=Microbacterium elymi TaxID=2909587 RepID=A0ABY5NKR3_9MICO|nr:SH3 domain-containing protein [Microbacterium elymi]UUT35757.1 SH3 domain-containing protein [Microbacterium elymi]
MQTLKQGQKYTRTGTSGVWWRLKVGTKTLWAHSDYLALEKAASTPKPSPKPTTKPTPKPTTTTKYVAVALNLRASASLSAKIVTTMPRGAKVTVLKKAGSWSQVKYGTRGGWVANAYLTSSAGSSSAKPSTPSSTAQKTIAALNLRTSASLSAKIAMTLPGARRSRC